ncbi:hypothetical protein BCR33DRAFT_545186 [Rhizoclosmatium globosum]|uniref:Uncharacterized protein n=1 Tax=Rhizoclosmatium globosum TaxID=329046 RepID=A0A1Y2B9R0_9FUNG|nr:hypothetical protein BCR33DRAFT_545186 [Rhizoclosmatium globosum]|eukprot:ORY31569.1 hypothetical protein BCR33DRAFT_545186 [Rhizoclosmatium globosum]
MVGAHLLTLSTHSTPIYSTLLRSRSIGESFLRFALPPHRKLLPIETSSLTSHYSPPRFSFELDSFGSVFLVLFCAVLRIGLVRLSLFTFFPFSTPPSINKDKLTPFIFVCNTY